MFLPRGWNKVRRDERPHLLSAREDLAKLVRAHAGRIVASAEVVDDEDGCLEHVVDDIPSAVFENVQQIRPVPEQAVEVTDDVGFFHVLLAVADKSDPTADGLGAMRLAGAVAASEDQQASTFWCAPSVKAEAARLSLKFLELRMPRGFELQVLGVPACVWRLPRSPLDR